MDPNSDKLPDTDVTDKKAGQMPPSYKTIASFCEYTAEMLTDVSDSAELTKRHRDSLTRLRDGLDKLLDGEE